MTGQDLLKLGLVLGQQQGVQRLLADHAESLVRRGEYGERAGALQRIDQIGGSHGGDQSGVDRRVHGILDDVLLGEHLRPADHRVRGIRVGQCGSGGQRQGGGSAKNDCFHDVSPE